MALREADNQITSAVGELIQWHQRKSQNFCDTYIFEPENEHEALFGKLLVLVKIDENTKKAQEISDGLATVLQHSFYSGPDNDFVQSFESALAKANTVLSELAAAGEVRWIGKLSAIVCAQKEHELVLARAGHAKAFLIRDGKPVEVGEASEPGAGNSKAFNSIAQGDVMPKDQIVLSTGKLLNSVSLAQISQALKENPVLTAIRQIEPLIDSDATVPTCALFLKVDTARAIALENQKDEQLAELSPEELSHGRSKRQLQNWYDDFRSRRWTMKIVAIGGLVWMYIKKGGGAIGSFASGLLHSGRERLAARRELNKEAEAFVAAKDAEIRNEDDESLSSFTKTPELETSTIEEVQKPKKAADKVLAVGAQAKSLPQRLKNLPHTISEMPLKSKILLSGAAALVIVFVVSLSVFGARKSDAAKSQQYSALLADAEQRNNEAQAALIYNDTDKARELWGQAKDLTGQVLASSFYSAEASALQQKIDAGIYKLDHANEIQDLTEVANFESLGSVTLTGLTVEGGTVYTVNSANNHVLKATEGGSAEDTGVAASDMAPITALFPFVDTTSAVALSNSGEVGLWDSTKSTFTKQSIQVQDSTIPSGSTYTGKYLYLLYPSKNAIYKYTKATSGFGKGSKWNLSGDVSDVISIAVDGNLYALRSNGTITQFVKGAPGGITFAAPEKPLVQATQIATSEHMKNLYVADAGSKRIVAYSKDGAVLHEYEADALSSMTSMFVDEENKLIYAVVGSTVVKFGIVQ